MNIPASLYEALLFHALSDESNEIMGLLIGELSTADNDDSDDPGKFDSGRRTKLRRGQKRGADSR